MNTLNIDFGGTVIKLGLTSANTIIETLTLPAHSDRSFAERLESVEKAIHELYQKSQSSIHECNGIAIGFPATVDNINTQINSNFGKYTDAQKINLTEWAKERFGLMVAIENDARLAAIGEWQHGAGRQCQNLVMLTIGTGLGTGVIIDGQVLRGHNGQAGCLGGHFTVNYEGRPCLCGNIGCAEAEASSVNLEMRVKSDCDFEKSSLSEIETIDYQALFECAKENDRLAVRIAEHSIKVWSALSVTLIHAYNPEILVLGGGVMKSYEYILPRMEDYISEYAIYPKNHLPKIAVSELGDHAALAGGEWLINEAISRNTPLPLLNE